MMRQMLPSDLQSKRGSRLPAVLAFSLVEVTIALGIAAFCLIPLLGLLMIGLNVAHATSEQMAATGLATSIAADFQAIPANKRTPRFKIALPTTGSYPSASPASTLFFAEDCVTSGSTAVASGITHSRYRVDIAYGQRVATSQPIPVRILITWPAVANRTTLQWPTHTDGSVQILTCANGSGSP